MKYTYNIFKFGNLKTLAVVCILTLPLLFSGCDYFSISDTSPPAEYSAKVDNPIVKEPVNLQILCTGDIMVHSTQIQSQMLGNGVYDYRNNYKYVKKYIESADLAICNLETTFAGRPYTGYPNFSSPDELAEAIKWAGFDVVSTANNHMMDKGTKGVLRTLDVLEEYGLQATGSRKHMDTPRYVMEKIKGVNIATIAYTYETPSTGTAINGHIVPTESTYLINSFDYETLDEDLNKIKEVCRSARKDGADVVILFFHWGEEYQRSSGSFQRKIAEYMVNEANVDIIFGAHTHVLQEATYLEKPQEGAATAEVKKVPVFYSLGNFISNQRMETLNNRFTETGAMALVDIKFDLEKRSILENKMSAIPTWVARYHSSGRPTYEIIPLDENMESNPTLVDTRNLERAKQALEDAIGTLKIN